MKKIVVCCFIAMAFAACKKDNAPKPPSAEPETPLAPEVITTLRIYIYDSIGTAQVPGSPFTFKDADGDGGAPGVFLNNGADSVIVLNANSEYSSRIVILDETTSPPDSVSNDVGGDDSYEHMLFYNGNTADSQNNRGNSVLSNSASNYEVMLNGSGVRIRYTDTDNGAAHNQTTRPVGLTTRIKTGASTSGNKYPFIVALRHQPDAKDGTYAPGETDIEVAFRIKVN